jgi:hypothetical protein
MSGVQDRWREGTDSVDSMRHCAQTVGRTLHRGTVDNSCGVARAACNRAAAESPYRTQASGTRTVSPRRAIVDVLSQVSASFRQNIKE